MNNDTKELIEKIKYQLSVISPLFPYQPHSIQFFYNEPYSPSVCAYSDYGEITIFTNKFMKLSLNLSSDQNLNIALLLSHELAHINQVCDYTRYNIDSEYTKRYEKQADLYAITILHNNIDYVCSKIDIDRNLFDKIYSNMTITNTSGTIEHILSSKELVEIFFKDIAQYSTNNFKYTECLYMDTDCEVILCQTPNFTSILLDRFSITSKGNYYNMDYYLPHFSKIKYFSNTVIITTFVKSKRIIQIFCDNRYLEQYRIVNRV